MNGDGVVEWLFGDGLGVVSFLTQPVFDELHRFGSARYFNVFTVVVFSTLLLLLVFYKVLKKAKKDFWVFIVWVVGLLLADVALVVLIVTGLRRL